MRVTHWGCALDYDLVLIIIVIIKRNSNIITVYGY